MKPKNLSTDKAPKKEYDLSKMKSRKNPYAKRLTEQLLKQAADK